MKNSLHGLILSSGLFLSAAASAADSSAYICNVKDLGNGFISQTFTVQFEANAKTAIVYDAIIYHVYGAPMEAKKKDRGNGKHRFTYRVKDIPANPKKIDISFRVDLDTKTNALVVRGFLPGYENMIVGKGQCERRAPSAG